MYNDANRKKAQSAEKAPVGPSKENILDMGSTALASKPKSGFFVILVVIRYDKGIMPVVRIKGIILGLSKVFSETHNRYNFRGALSTGIWSRLHESR